MHGTRGAKRAYRAEKARSEEKKVGGRRKRGERLNEKVDNPMGPLYKSPGSAKFPTPATQHLLLVPLKNFSELHIGHSRPSP